MDNDYTEYTVFNYVLAMLVDSRSGDIVRRASIMAIPIEEGIQACSAELKTVALG